MNFKAGEPLYASVHKRSERCGPTGGDSWVWTADLNEIRIRHHYSTAEKNKLA